MSEWKRVKLGEVISLVIDHRGKTPTKLGGDWSNQGYRALSAKSVKTRQLVNLDAIRYVGEDLYRRWMKEEIQRGDILVTSEAPYGEVLYWNSDEKIVLSQRLFGLRVKTGVDSAYVAQYMTTSSFRKEMDARATGTTVFGLRQPELLDCAIELPPLPTQRKIAAVLGALDDKIENNRKICANLEAQAQALFKSWFVDFEPFGGKMPSGWKMGRLGDVCVKITDGSHSSPKGVVDGTYPMLSVKDMGEYDFEYLDCKRISRDDYSLMLANGCVPAKDDIVVAKDGSYLKSIFIINEDKEQAVLSSIAIFRPDATRIAPEYLLWYLKSPETICRIKSTCVTGSGVPRIVLKDFRSIEIILPCISDIQFPIEVFRSIRRSLDEKVKESRALAATRDALLPKLMSGEIDVEKVEV